MAGGLRIEGVERLQRALQGLSGTQALSALRAPMTAAGAKILTDAKRLTPRDTGALVNSASQQIETGGQSITVTLGYNTPYAEPVHERNLNYRVGQWKYLQEPMERHRVTVWNDVARGIEAWLRRTA